MKRYKITALLLAILFLFTGISACSPNNEATKTPSPTPSLTASPTPTFSPEATPSVSPTPTADSATPTPEDEHLHLDPVVYPDKFDFEDPDSITRAFDLCREVKGLKVTVKSDKKQVILGGNINDNRFVLTIDLSKAAGNTTPEQIVTCAKLFWHCYPLMYARFAVKSTPTSVILRIENEGYEIASASGNSVHIHDEWLKKSPNDYDCLTHEFAHIIQGGWDGNFVPTSGDDTYMIERFADYCRYLYAYRNGYYNDTCWELQSAGNENSYVKGVRFWVWLDYTYSEKDADIMQRIQQAVYKKTYTRADWQSGGKAWEQVFKDTGAYGKDLDILWGEYTKTSICKLSSVSPSFGVTSVLLRMHPLRQAVKDRYPGIHDYWLLEK